MTPNILTETRCHETTQTKPPEDVMKLLTGIFD